MGSFDFPLVVDKCASLPVPLQSSSADVTNDVGSLRG